MNLEELRRTAAERLTDSTWAYIQSVAEDETGRSQHEWASVALIPRAFKDVAQVSTLTSLVNQLFKTPIIVSPTGAHGLCHPNMELETARGAAESGALFCYSAFASLPVTKFAQSAPGPWCAQLYHLQDAARTNDYVDLCAGLGATALILTVDHKGGRANAQFRDSLRGRLSGSPGNFPGWTWEDLTSAISPHVDIDLISHLHQRTGLPVVVKGILHPDDAVAAAEAGAAAIFVSNHGRRQLGGVISTTLALSAITDAIAGKIPVYVDGGIRSSTDILRALTLGASAVGIGRPVLWALASGGASSVSQLIDALTLGLERSMTAMGMSNIQ